MRNPQRLTPRLAHLAIPLIATLLLAACDTGGQLPYEQAGPDEGVSSFENTAIAEPDPALGSDSKASASNTKPTRSAQSSAAGPAGSSAGSSLTGNAASAPSPVDTATPATTTAPDVAAQTAVQKSTQTASDPEDKYLLTPTETDSNPGINYQQSNSKSAPVIVTFDAQDPQRIDVIVRDAMPVSKAILSDPDRHQYLAQSMAHKSIAFDAEGASDADVGVNVMGDPSQIISGVGLNIPIVPSGSTAGGSLNESRFSFVIPDRALYNGDWQHWKIHIDLGDAINGRSMELLPPKPQQS